jgi:hypothetical protein
VKPLASYEKPVLFPHLGQSQIDTETIGEPTGEALHFLLADQPFSKQTGPQPAEQQLSLLGGADELHVKNDSPLAIHPRFPSCRNLQNTLLLEDIVDRVTEGDQSVVTALTTRA